MNEGGPISEFFFNLIPGSLFLLIFNVLTKGYLIEILLSSWKEEPGEGILISFYIIGGLFMGFFFQCLTKTVRKLYWNENAFRNVLSKESNKDELRETELKLKMKGTKIFFYMDNYLRGLAPAFLPTHFSSRFSFWSNITWGAFFITITASMYGSPIIMLCFILLTIFSGIMASWHLENYYDTIFKTFYMKVTREDLNKNSK